MSAVMKFCDMKPFIRYAQCLEVKAGRRAFLSLTAYDNRLFYCKSGSGEITVDGQVYDIRKGSLIFWRAGSDYSLYTDSDMVLLGCNFDFTLEHAFLSAPIPPSKSSEFNRKSIVETVHFEDAPCFSSVVYLNNMHLIERRLSEIHGEFLKHLAFYNERMSALFHSVLCDVLRETIFSTASSGKKSVIDEILLYVSENYKEELNNATLGRQFGYHPNYINHLVVQHTGMSLHKYLLTARINRAIDLLQTTDMPVSLIATEVGFSDYNHFLKYFKQATGYTTKAFRSGK